MRIRIIAALSIVCLTFVYMKDGLGQMSSTNFGMEPAVFSGSGGFMVSTQLQLGFVLGQLASPGVSTNTSNRFYSGLWYEVFQALAGDVDGSGQITIADVIAALQVVTGMAPETVTQAADVNGDGQIAVGEALMVLKQMSEEKK